VRSSGADDPTWFPLSFRNKGADRITYVLDTLFGGGPGKAGVRVQDAELRVWMVGFKLTVPRESVQAVARSDFETHGTSGVHGKHGRWLVNGCADGLVELSIDPPATLPRRTGTAFRKLPVHTLVLSLEDPDRFIAALGQSSNADPS
jgi:hypothetical protein